jgi:hypothetical protein
MKALKKNELYRQILDNLREKEGCIRPESVVKLAKDPKHPMHKLFEWDDKKAGCQYRVYQARLLINRITIDMIDVSADAYELFVPVTTTGSRKRGYYSVNEIMNNDEMRKQVLMQALNLAKYWMEKYKQYKELRGIINPRRIKQLEATLKN